MYLPQSQKNTSSSEKTIQKYHISSIQSASPRIILKKAHLLCFWLRQQGSKTWLEIQEKSHFRSPFLIYRKLKTCAYISANAAITIAMRAFVLPHLRWGQNLIPLRGFSAAEAPADLATATRSRAHGLRDAREISIGFARVAENHLGVVENPRKYKENVIGDYFGISWSFLIIFVLFNQE